MGRIRAIKPEFAHSESMGRVSRDARLLFLLLWTICDDDGRTRAASRMLASLLFPYDEDAPGLIDGWLVELERERCVHRYEGDDGSHYLQVCNWKKHQRIDKPSPSKIPPPSAKPREDSRTFLVGLDQGLDLKEGRKEEPAADSPEADALRRCLSDLGVLGRASSKTLATVLARLLEVGWTPATVREVFAAMDGKTEKQRAGQLASLLLDDAKFERFNDDLCRRAAEARYRNGATR